MNSEAVEFERGPLDGCVVRVPLDHGGIWCAIKHSNGEFLIYKSRWSSWFPMRLLLEFHNDNGVDRWSASAPRSEVTRLRPIFLDADPLRIKLMGLLWDFFEGTSDCRQFGLDAVPPDLDSWMKLLNSLGIEVREEFPFEANEFFVLDATGGAHKHRGCFLPARQRSWFMIPRDLAMKILVLGAVP